jgi:hypothetical protein
MLIRALIAIRSAERQRRMRDLLGGPGVLLSLLRREEDFWERVGSEPFDLVLAARDLLPDPIGETVRAILQFPPVAAAPGDPQVASCPGERRFAVVAVGVPHLVVLVDDVAAVDLPARGPVLRSSPAVGPDGANVDWVSPGGKATWRMRTYERGVEAETLACGTGAVAVGTALVGWDLATFPVTLITQSGQQMDVQAQRLPGGQVQGVSLTGEARLVFRGVLE